ncbi:MAG: hypothetical protein HYY63_00895, partial [Elusimicrobia bacterium]|nr:hypothetical protein [Elusimicrobiota bacterium]
KFQNDDALVSVLGGKGGRLSIAGGAGHDGNSGAVHYNQRPSVPILLSPLTQSTTVQPLFRWQESQDTEGTTSFTYQLQVSFDGEIYSHWSDPWVVIADTVAPVGGFIDFVSAEITSCTVNLQNAADPNGEIHFQPFLIEVSSSAGFAGKTDSSGWQKDRVWKVIGLSANTTYYFRSKTRDSVLNESDWSPTRLQVTEVSPVPDITVSRVGVSSCTLSWGKSFPENPSQTIYEIQFSSAGFQMENLIVSTHATAGSGWIALEGLLPNRNYHGRLVAKNWQGSASVSATFSTVTLARPPASVQVSLLGSTSIQMTQGGSDNPDGTAYLSQVSTSSDFSFIYSSSLTQNISLVHDSLQPNSPYFLRVSARNQSGRDHFSQIWSFQTLPSLPSLLRFSSVTAESLEVQWEENKNPPNTEYRLEISTSKSDPETQNFGSWQKEKSSVYRSLSANTTYWIRLKSKNSFQQETDFIPYEPVVTLSLTPPPPQIVSGYDEKLGYYMRIFPSVGKNHPHTELAIQNITNGEYLQGDGTTASEPVWKSQMDWTASFAANVDSVLAGLETYRYRVWSQNFAQIVNPQPSQIASEITPPEETSVPIVQELEKSRLEVKIRFVQGASRYWIYCATSPTIPAQNYIHIGTVTPSETSFQDDVDGIFLDPPSVSTPVFSASSITFSWTVPKLSPSTPRYYRVSAVDNRDREGVKSGVGLGNSQVSPIVTEYGIYRNNLFLTSTTALVHVDTQTTPGVPYRYSVVAKSNENRMSPPGYASLFGGIPIPEKPSFRSPPKFSPIKLEIQWGDGGNPPGTSYELDVKNWSAMYGALTPEATGFTILTTSLSVTLPALTPGNTYYLQVRAKSPDGIYGPYCDLGSVVAPLLSISSKMDPLQKNSANEIQNVTAGPNPWEPARKQFLSIYHLPANSQIHIYGVTGQKVSTLNDPDPGGVLRWNGTNQNGEPLASGVYFLYVRDGANSKRISLTLVR